ncbi:uncharacterized protein LOC120290699 [Eucalyptus grandis]|uniref:uncharacterized protein LOC120290699 n=1 Tax=Eucalyptus grandis TaxID=71139 RepID=UPI00192EC347|nr:uncharacterized protein LOC120290699 [Eucalyptus grandis]
MESLPSRRQGQGTKKDYVSSWKHNLCTFRLWPDWTEMDSSALLFNQLKAAELFFLLAGLNVIESEEHVLHMVKHIKSVAAKYVLGPKWGLKRERFSFHHLTSPD